LRSGSLQYDEINYAKTGLTEATVKAIVDKVGSIAPLLNTRHATVKEKGWADKLPSAAAFAKAVVADPNVLKRPILVLDDKVIIGFDKPAYAKL